MSDEHAVARINDGWYVCECGQSGAERWAILHQFPNQRVRPVSDDISDTIAAAIEDAERSCGPREYQQSATHVLAVLRERYAIVEREELASSLASAIRAYIDAEVAGGRTADRGINVLQRLDYEADSIARYALTHESLKEADQK